MDGLLGERLGAGIDGDAHLPTRFVERSRVAKKSEPKTPSLSMSNPDYISEALKQQLRAQDKWGCAHPVFHLLFPVRSHLSSLTFTGGIFTADPNFQTI